MTTTTRSPAAGRSGSPGGPAGEPAPPSRRSRRARVRARLSRLDIKASPYGLVAPFFVVFGIFGVFPFLYTAYVSLFDWNLLEAEHTFIGLGNFARLLTDPYFWKALTNTLSIWVLATVPQLLLALGLAHLLNTRLRARTLFRMGVLLPNITSVVAVAIIFSQLFGTHFGLINWILGLGGVEPVNWHAGMLTSHTAIAVMVIWRWTGYNALIYLAAMQAIPDELYESARLDGANGLQQLWHVTVPVLRPTIIFTVIVSTIGGLQLFAEPLLFGAGGVTGGAARQFQTFALYMYEQGFRRFDFGYAAALTWVVFVVIGLVAAINFLIVRRIRSAG